MDHAAPAVFQALEGSAFGAVIRQSIFIYPLANVGHVVAVVAFFAAVAVMDARLLGAFRAVAPGEVVRKARRFAVAAFAGVALFGFLLFTAEASHLALNPVFQFKLILIGLGLVNVVVFELAFGRRLAGWPPVAPLPGLARASAFFSLAVWITVVACGRSIAYF